MECNCTRVISDETWNLLQISGTTSLTESLNTILLGSPFCRFTVFLLATVIIPSNASFAYLFSEAHPACRKAERSAYFHLQHLHGPDLCCRPGVSHQPASRLSAPTICLVLLSLFASYFPSIIPIPFRIASNFPPEIRPTRSVSDFLSREMI
jgi:hypothetical protein